MKCAQHLLPSCSKWRCSNWWKLINFCYTLFLGFLQDKMLGGGSPQVSRDYKISLKLSSCKSNQKAKRKPLETHALLSRLNWANANFGGCGAHRKRREPTDEVQTIHYASTSAKSKCFLVLVPRVPTQAALLPCSYDVETLALPSPEPESQARARLTFDLRFSKGGGKFWGSVTMGFGVR